MSNSGAYTLSEAPARIIIECDACKRRGEYSRQRLIAEHGDITLPELKSRVVNCARLRDITHLGGCRARFTPESLPE